MKLPLIYVPPTNYHQRVPGQFAYAASQLLRTVNFDLQDIKDWAILDSGATSHFLVTDAPVINIRPASNPLSVQIPNGQKVNSTHTCELNVPALPKQARLGHILPGLAAHSLLSVVKLCNAGCDVKLTKIDCTVKYNGRLVLQGYKCARSGLWMVPITGNKQDTEATMAKIPELLNQAVEIQQGREYVNNAIPTSSRAELAMYYHQTMCSPPKSTFLKAIKNGHFITFPGLTYELISKHLPPSTATEKGHMTRTRQGVRSTRSNRNEILDARMQVDNMHPHEEACNIEDDKMFCFAALADANEGTVYSDLTGRFPVRSYSGMQYIFVAYIYSKNAILMRAMPNRTDASMINVFKDIYETLKTRGWQPKLHVLDNECSKAVQKYIREENVRIQIVEPHNHRVNAAEPAVKTTKYHLVAGLATVHKDCPLQIWDRFLQQAEDTLNLLRTSRTNTKISAYEDLHGAFDFNRTPMAPFGTKGLAFVDPDERTTFGPHALEVFVVG